MASGKVFVGDYGRTALLLDTKVTLTGDTVVLVVRKPGVGTAEGEVVVWDAEVREITKVFHLIKKDELDIAGEYRIFPKVVAPDGSYEEKGAAFTLTVFNLFD